MAKKKKFELVKVTREDVGGRFWVDARLTSASPQDRMMESQIAQSLRQPNKNGVPLMSDEDLLRHVFHFEHPEEITNRAQQQALLSENPEVQKMKMAALLRDWREDNKELIKAAEKELTPPPEDADEKFEKFKKELTKEKFKQMVQMMAQAEHAKMMGQDPGQAMKAMQMAATAQQGMNAQNAGLPASVQPPERFGGGVPPEAMPSQMAMADASAQTSAIPEEQEVEQLARGKARNMHKG